MSRRGDRYIPASAPAEFLPTGEVAIRSIPAFLNQLNKDNKYNSGPDHFLFISVTGLQYPPCDSDANYKSSVSHKSAFFAFK